MTSISGYYFINGPVHLKCNAAAHHNNRSQSLHIINLLHQSIAMRFATYAVNDPVLKRYVPFILFNHCSDPSYRATLSYFPNLDVCLGLVKEKQLKKSASGLELKTSGNSFTAYLSGIYQQPHILEVNGTLDEVCIIFTPLGYYHFFKLPLKQYILGEDIIPETFGKDAVPFIENIFTQDNLKRRGELIEQFLASKLNSEPHRFLKEAIHVIEQTKGSLTVAELAGRLCCTEKKLQRYFTGYLDITPKHFCQIMKFRQALQLMSAGVPSTSLTNIALEAGYYDQSHFIKNIWQYTGNKPADVQKDICSIDSRVLYTIN